MIRSMTGFGSAGLETEEVRAAVSARSLNHRYLDVTVHLPRRLQPLEAEVKDAVGRGGAPGARRAVGPGDPRRGRCGRRWCRRGPLVASLVRALRDMQNEFGLEGGVAVSDLVRFPGALERAETPATLSAETRQTLLALVEEALSGSGAHAAVRGRAAAD